MGRRGFRVGSSGAGHPALPLSPTSLRPAFALHGYWPLLAAATALALYGRTLGYGWVFDDATEVVQNTFVRSLSHLGQIFRNTAWAGSGVETYVYRPLPTATFALNYQISGLEPWSYHLVNVLLHGAVSAMVYLLGWRWGLGPTASGLGALLFALHPIHVEVAAAVFGRKDLLASFFLLLMVLTHPWAARRGGGRTLVPVLSFLGGLCSKEVAVAGPFLVAAQDLWSGASPHGEARRRGTWLYGAYGLVLAAYLAVRWTVVGAWGVPATSPLDNPLVEAPLVTRMATAAVVLGKGVGLLVAPHTLSPDYSFNAIPLVRSPLDTRLWASLVLLALALATLLFRGLPRLPGRGGPRRNGPVGLAEDDGQGSSMHLPFLKLAVSWYFLALLPAANVFVLSGTIFGERLLYLPSVAACLLGGWVLAGGVRKNPRIWGLPVAAYLLALTAQTIRYTGAWKDDLSLFRWAAAAAPASTKVHHKLGEEWLRRGELGEALRSLDRALAVAPWNEFAGLTRHQAVAHVAARYSLVLAAPWDAAGWPRDPELLYTLGHILRERGDTLWPPRLWEEALILDPEHPLALTDLAVSRIMAGDTLTGLLYLERAVRRSPSLPTAWYNLAQLRLARGELPRAREALRRFLEGVGPTPSPEAAWARQLLAEIGPRP